MLELPRSLCVRGDVLGRFSTSVPSNGPRAAQLFGLSPPLASAQRVEGSLRLYGVMASCPGQGVPVDSKGVFTPAPSS
jgi:hypothetical protein